MLRKIGVLTSGGDSPGMNAAIRAVTRTAMANGIEVVGIHDGYKGLVEGLYENFERHSVSETIDRGGTILGVEKVKENKIDAVVVIGGDGTYRGADALTKLGVNCIALPGTIDNDIEGTDYTIGFDTELNTIVECVDKLRDTSNSHHRCSVVEVMGNRCGDLAIYSGISCGAEILITPETGYDEEAVLEKLRYLENQGLQDRLASQLLDSLSEHSESRLETYVDEIGEKSIGILDVVFKNVPRFIDPEKNLFCEKYIKILDQLIEDMYLNLKDVLNIHSLDYVKYNEIFSAIFNKYGKLIVELIKIQSESDLN